MEKVENEVLLQGAEAKQTKKAQVKAANTNLPAVIHPAADLAKTIKMVSDLHTLIKQRDRLEFYTDELQAFEVKNEPEDLDDTRSYYTGCRIEIIDDHNRKFNLKHPGVIKEVVDFMHKRFAARKAEIEKQIKLPQVA